MKMNLESLDFALLSHFDALAGPFSLPLKQ
jgi:hypothetical protein